MDMQPENGQFALKSNPVDLRHIVATFRANLRLVGILVAVGLALALLVTLLQTPRYTATTTLQINNTGGRFLKNQDASQSEDDSVNASDTDRFLKTQIDVIKSRGLAERVVNRLRLSGNPEFYASQGASAPKPGSSPDEIHEKVMQILSKNLTVTIPRDSRVTTIKFVSSNPGLSRDIVNTYAKEFIQWNLQRKFESSDYARGYISNQLAEVKQRLEDSEKNLNAYSRSVGLIHTRDAGPDPKSGGQTGSVVTSSLLQVNAAANDAQTRRMAAEARWRTINAGPLLSSTEVVSNAAVSQLMAQRATIETALDNERARHLDSYPTVQSKKAELTAINQQIQQMATNIRNAVKAEYEAAVAAEGALDAQVAKLKSETLTEQDKTVQSGLLQREVDTNREVYEGLLQRYKELNAEAGISLSNVSIIDQADMPLKPTSPDLLNNLLIGLVAGIGIAVITVFIKDLFDEAVRVPDDIEAKLGLTVLGVIPVTQSDDVNGILQDPKSAVAEAYSSLRSALQYSTSEGLPHVLAVTSAQQGEGKTTTSYSLAEGFARVGKRVLLIDADMRRPSLHRWIDSDNEVGFSTLLTSQVALADAVLPTACPTLGVITAGPIPPNPTELLSGRRIEELLIEAAREYDLVVIDAPPVLGLADAPLLSALVDGVVFLVEADRNRNGALRTSVRRLQSVRAFIVGGVLTKFDPLKAASRYGSYYGYEYYQYQYSPQSSARK